MKKTKNKKILIAGGLAVACIGVLVGVFLLLREPEPDFTPNESSSIQTASEWTEPDTPKIIAGGASDNKAPGIEVDSDVAGEETNSKLTNTNSAKPSEPEAPDMGKDINDPDNPPTYTPEQTNPPANNGPAAGDQNGSGQIYDPVFGWITPGAGQGDVADGNGDPDKEIGNM